MRKIALLSFILLISLLSFAQKHSARRSSVRPTGSATATNSSLPASAQAAIKAVDAEKIRQHVRFLSSDLLEGRGTGQRGGDIAAEYIATQFALLGLKPAGDNGTYMQKVPMVGITPGPETTFELFPNKGQPMQLKPLDQYVAYDET